MSKRTYFYKPWFFFLAVISLSCNKIGFKSSWSFDFTLENSYKQCFFTSCTFEINLLFFFLIYPRRTVHVLVLIHQCHLQVKKCIIDGTFHLSGYRSGLCVFRSMDGHRSPEWLYSPVKVTNVVAWIIQAWICTMDWPVEKTPPTDMILEREVMIHDGGTIEKRERWWIMRKNLFSGLERAGGGGWGTPPLVGYFQEKWLVFTSIIAPFPPTPGLWFPRNPDTFRLLGWSTINASLDFSSIYRGLNSLHTLTVFQRFQLKTLLNGKEGFERAGGHHQTLWIKILVQTFTG